MSVRPCSSISAIGLGWLALAATVAQATDSLARGESLFFGRVSLSGQPRGHSQSMSTQAIRCSNCHSVITQTEGKVPLNRVTLTAARARRNGPPSAYDEASFCTMLRTGVDPAHMMGDYSMPVYALAAEDCAALWTYITRDSSSEESRVVEQ